jgi:hypothetical protein
MIHSKRTNKPSIIGRIESRGFVYISCLDMDHRTRISKIAFLLLLAIITVPATEVTWTSNAEPGNHDPAKTAPRSQRFWDEHNIERPDYAKTDAEIAAEKGEAVPSKWSFYLAIIAVAAALGLMAGMYVRRAYPLPIGGARLGSSNDDIHRFPSWFPAEEDAVEQARKARLARFEGKLD